MRMQTIPPPTSTADSGRVVLTVSQLNRDVRDLLEQGLPLLWVEGEISNLARPASGHWYFTLKDTRAQIRCAMFRPRNRLVRFQPANGSQILVRGRVSLYEPRGDYQLIVESMEDAGDGALRRQFEELKARLQAEGLFDAGRKQPLPPLPRRIGVITSPSGAAIRDVLQVLRRRFPAIEVMIYPVPVQGAGSAEQIARMLALADSRDEVDVLLVTRGGGSLEDLWAFNEEVVARAIAACALPVVSAVGHEVDVSIADFVADQRAPTPSAAAELLSPDGDAWARRLGQLAQRLHQLAQGRIQQQQRQLNSLSERLTRQHPGRRLRDHGQRLDELDLRLRGAWTRAHQLRGLQLAQLQQRLRQRHPARTLNLLRNQVAGLEQRLVTAQAMRLERRQQRLVGLARALDAVSPLATVSRGYAIVQRQDGSIVRDAVSVDVGERLSARLARGRVECRVEAIEEDHPSR